MNDLIKKHCTDLHLGDYFEGLPVNTFDHSTGQPRHLSRSRLTKQLLVFNRALAAYSRVLIVHVVVHFPTDAQANTFKKNGAISRYISSFQSHVAADLRRKKSASPDARIHGTDVRYFWARERDTSINEHYHIMFFLNGNTYRKAGSYNDFSCGGLFAMLNDAWSSALGLPQGFNHGLVHLAGMKQVNVRQITTTLIERYDMQMNSKQDAFYWLSYLAKLDSRDAGGGRSYGYSNK